MQFFPRPLALLIVASLLPAAGIAAPEVLRKAEYDRIRAERNEAPSFTAREMDGEAARFLEVVKATWDARSRACPDPAFAKIAQLIGMKETVQGVVAFHTHKTPPFSLTDHRRNAKEAVIAATLTIALPTSVDNLIHTKEGAAYIRVSETCVEVFEDAGKGLARTFYVKPDQGEQG